MFAQLARAAALVATLTLTGQTAAAALHEVAVRRTSLLGYEVAGVVWEADDAARALAYEADRASLVEEPTAPAQRHPDLVTVPHRVFGGFIHETWRGDPRWDRPVQRRIATLRASLVGWDVTQATHTSRGMSGSRTTTVITYPAGIAVPPIEVV